MEHCHIRIYEKKLIQPPSSKSIDIAKGIPVFAYYRQHWWNFVMKRLK